MSLPMQNEESSVGAGVFALVAFERVYPGVYFHSVAFQSLLSSELKIAGLTFEVSLVAVSPLV